MRHLFQQYLSSIVVLSFGLIGMMIAFVYLMQPQIANSTNIDESLLEHGVYGEVNQKNTYTFEVENEVTANFLDYNPRDEKYFTAKYYDGSDLKDFVLIKGAPGFRDKEGDYNVSYYLKFEGSTDVKTMLVHFTRIGNPYLRDIYNVQTLYDVGESNLTEDDIIEVGDVECYVLWIDEENNRAQMITKDLYDVRFDTTGQNIYKYKDSTLKTWMDDFYSEYLDSEPYILDTTIKSHYSGEFGNYSNASYRNTDPRDTGSEFRADGVTLSEGVFHDEITQKVFPIDVYDLIDNVSKFDIDYYLKNGYDYGFWTNAGTFKNGSASAIVFKDYTYSGSPRHHYSSTTYPYIYARPVFWLSLED